jgi:hypothetical protein
MKTKRLLFVLTIILISSVLFTACAPEQTTDAINTPSAEDAATPDGGESDNAEPVQEKYAFPGEDYGGYEMRVIVPDHDDWAISTIMAEEEDGDPINDAIYRRNQLVEEGLNIKITEILVSGPESRAKKPYSQTPTTMT